MALKQFTIEFWELGKDYSFRNDEKYHVFLHFSDWNLFNVQDKKLIPLKNILMNDYKLFAYKEGEEYKGIPTGQTYLDEDGNIKDFQIVTLEGHPGRLKYKASNDNILISSLRLAKSPALYFENEDLSDYVFSNGFYIFKVKDGWNNKFILYVLRTKKLKNILDNHIYRGIGISAYKCEDLLKIKIPIISESTQDKIVAQIEPIENKIKELKTKIRQPQEIINEVFARKFGFDLNKVYSFEKIKHITISNNYCYRNEQIRSSYRWHKLREIQNVLYENNQYIFKLGKFIKSTRNGWSPNCKESDNLYAVLGIDALSKETIIKFDNLKYTNETKGNINDFLVKDDDFFVSRGNTVNLVALASIVKFQENEMDVIFSDLFIRIDLDKNIINNRYMAYLFNSVIGRLYFKYSAKGKNQTMVKISSSELNNFYLPIPSLNLQQKIVDEIKAELDKQEETKKQIGAERNKIDKIIEKAIT